MRKKKELSISELIFLGSIQFVLAFTVLLNGFTYLTERFIKDGQTANGPTKQKGLLAVMALIEKGWWKYLIILFFGTVGFLMIKEAKKKIGLLQKKNNTKLKSKKGNKSAVILKEYIQSNHFNNDKKYFNLGNFGIFELTDNLDDFIHTDYKNVKGVPFAYNTTYDGDQLYVLFIGVTEGINECGVFINHCDHLAYSNNPYACLKQPIKIAASLNELFNDKSLDALLNTKTYYEKLLENAYHSNNPSIKTTAGFIPQLDLRTLFKKEAKHALIINHREYDDKTLNDFLIDASLSVQDEFTTFPGPVDYDKLVKKANANIGKDKYFYILFGNSGFHGIGSFEDLTKSQICNFLGLGLFYRMSEIDLKFYDLNNEMSKTIYTKQEVMN